MTSLRSLAAATGAATLAAMLASACAPAERPGGGLDRSLFKANPSAVIAVDIGQNRAAQVDGVAKALKDTAASDAITFVPQPVLAKDWLRGAPAFPATAWSPHAVHLSCDGLLAVTTGAIRWGGTDGYYTTVWQGSGRRGDEPRYRWVLSHGDGVESPRIAPEFIQSSVANCTGTPSAPAPSPAPPVPAGNKAGRMTSPDGTLRVTWRYDDDAQRRTVAVESWDGSAFQTKLLDDVKPAIPGP
ncbi:hypothetical protein HME9302_00144 [Alteripontixanthobacter maritimus]|uniref:Uncharacterized protein n=1 Tax=Alteripontixanthobacter maritimus TaxID=2161824 RepID=A0A369Q6M6_9SPHN|nr:hypothetical protein [Alteripontixanthobacter maritimus]RDC58967.1 hypothetical protein HME9302_00144 [Alteripontixanthobacter maritimus]